MIQLAWVANFMLIYNKESIKLSKGFRDGEENEKLEEKNKAGYKAKTSCGQVGWPSAKTYPVRRFKKFGPPFRQAWRHIDFDYIVYS